MIGKKWLESEIGLVFKPFLLLIILFFLQFSLFINLDHIVILDIEYTCKSTKTNLNFIVNSKT